MNDLSLMNVKSTVVNHIVCGGEVVNLISISRSEPDFNFTFYFLKGKKLKEIYFSLSLLELPIFTIAGHCQNIWVSKTEIDRIDVFVTLCCLLKINISQKTSHFVVTCFHRLVCQKYQYRFPSFSHRVVMFSFVLHLSII